MSSIQRTYKQRSGTNLTQIIPVFQTTVTVPFAPIFELSGTPIYTLNIPQVQNIGGSYWVDLSGLDSNGNLLDISGSIQTSRSSATIINFQVVIPYPASRAPGLEFTIFFKNPPFNRFVPGLPLFAVGIVSSDSYAPPFPIAVSPPVPWLISQSISQSVTYKSDGTNYNISSSGPAGWMGIFVLAALLSQI